MRLTCSLCQRALLMTERFKYRLHISSTLATPWWNYPLKITCDGEEAPLTLYPYLNKAWTSATGAFVLHSLTHAGSSDLITVAQRPSALNATVSWYKHRLCCKPKETLFYRNQKLLLSLWKVFSSRHPLIYCSRTEMVLFLTVTPVSLQNFSRLCRETF